MQTETLPILSAIPLRARLTSALNGQGAFSGFPQLEPGLESKCINRRVAEHVPKGSLWDRETAEDFMRVIESQIHPLRVLRVLWVSAIINLVCNAMALNA